MRTKHKLKAHHLLILIVFIIAFIILPTGTPEDLFTTVLFIYFFGWKAYLLMVLAVILLALIVLPKRYRRKLY